MTGLGLYLIIVAAALIGLWFILYFIPIGLWFTAVISDVKISLLQLILMRWRKVPPSRILSSHIKITKTALTLNPNQM